jgi:hypothetical protein
MFAEVNLRGFGGSQPNPLNNVISEIIEKQKKIETQMFKQILIFLENKDKNTIENLDEKEEFVIQNCLKKFNDDLKMQRIRYQFDLDGINLNIFWSRENVGFQLNRPPSNYCSHESTQIAQILRKRQTDIEQNVSTFLSKYIAPIFDEGSYKFVSQSERELLSSEIEMALATINEDLEMKNLFYEFKYKKGKIYFDVKGKIYFDVKD